MKVEGADKFRINMQKLARIVPQEMAKASQKNGELLVKVAKVTVPVGKTGRARAGIKGTVVAEGYKVDFGPLSKVLEGGREAGTAKSGRKYGASKPTPFVNPALKTTAKRRSARYRRAASAAVKKALPDAG